MTDNITNFCETHGEWNCMVCRYNEQLARAEKAEKERDEAETKLAEITEKALLVLKEHKRYCTDGCFECKVHNLLTFSTHEGQIKNERVQARMDAFRERNELRARLATVEAELASLHAKANEAIRTENVCVLHDGGTSEGCAGCFMPMAEYAADLKAKLDAAKARISQMIEPAFADKLAKESKEHREQRDVLLQAISAGLAHGMIHDGPGVENDHEHAERCRACRMHAVVATLPEAAQAYAKRVVILENIEQLARRLRALAKMPFKDNSSASWAREWRSIEKGLDAEFKSLADLTNKDKEPS